MLHIIAYAAGAFVSVGFVIQIILTIEFVKWKLHLAKVAMPNKLSRIFEYCFWCKVFRYFAYKPSEDKYYCEKCGRPL